MLDQKFKRVRVDHKLVMGKNATLVTTAASGVETTIDLAELAALDGIAASDLAKIDGITDGTSAAGKALVLDSAGAIDTFAAKAITGGDSSLGVTGQAAAQGGAIVVTGGTSSTSGNAGGAVSLVGGTPGATGAGGSASVTAAPGGATSGIGGAANITAGAGTAGNASGGSVVVTAGAKHGSGLDGGIFVRGMYFVKMPAPQTATDTASLTDAQMIGGILVATPTAAAAYTVRTGTQLKAALPATLAADDAFDLVIINIGGTGDDITLTAATDITIVGDPVVRPSADSGTEQAGQGTFRFRFVTGTTFVAYRIA
jgi:hypothetical protein